MKLSGQGNQIGSCLLVVAVGLALAMATAAYADSSQSSQKLFKLHAESQHPLEIILPEGFSLVPPVDSGLIRQINDARNNVPNWHGFHHIVPGTAASRQ